MSERGIDRVRVKLDHGMVVLPWASREALLAQLATDKVLQPVVDEFRNAGTSSVVTFTDDDKNLLAGAIERWASQQPDGYEALPEGMWKLGRWLRIDTATERRLLVGPIRVYELLESAQSPGRCLTGTCCPTS